MFYSSVRSRVLKLAVCAFAAVAFAACTTSLAQTAKATEVVIYVQNLTNKTYLYDMAASHIWDRVTGSERAFTSARFLTPEPFIPGSIRRVTAEWQSRTGDYEYALKMFDEMKQNDEISIEGNSKDLRAHVEWSSFLPTHVAVSFDKYTRDELRLWATIYPSKPGSKSAKS